MFWNSKKLYITLRDNSGNQTGKMNYQLTGSLPELLFSFKLTKNLWLIRLVSQLDVL